MLKSAKQKASDKLNIIDRAAYEKLQQQNVSNDSNNQQKRIRNSKYKKVKTKETFNLLHFLKVKTPGSHQRRITKDGRRVGVPVRQQLKNRGKKREGARKKSTRLKKSILRYRQKKRTEIQRQQQQEQNLQLATVQLETLSLAPNHFLTEDVAVELTTHTIHSRRFRAYCDNCTTSRLGQLTEQLLRELHRFQKRAYDQNEIKARAHRRFVVGFREMQSFLCINKVKLAIIAPDCEECAGEAGLDETIANIKTKCQSQQIPYAFSLKRRQLSYVLYKKVPISCVAILDYDGAREVYAQLLEALQQAKQIYKDLQTQSKIKDMELNNIEVQ